VLYLSRFDFTLKHVSRIRIEKTDELSRRLDWKIGVEKDNSDQVFIKDHWICSLTEVVIEGPKVDIIENIKKTRRKDKEVVRVVEEMKKAEVKNLKENKWEIDKKLVIKEGKKYILKNEELRIEIIWLHHNTLVMLWQPLVTKTNNYTRQ